MIKKLLIWFLLLLLPLTCSGDWYEDAYLEMIAMPKFPAGMTYLAIYNDELLDADRSGGVPTSTFSASRDATHPATYFDSSGVMQKTETSNVGRFNHGEYDTSGFTAFTDGAGLRAESASTNEITYSDDFGQAPWATTNVTVGADNVTCVDGAVRTTNTLTASDANGTVLYTIAAAGDARTFSVFLKRKTGTGSILISADNDFTTAGSFTTCALSTDWRRFTITNPAANGVCGIKIITNTDAIYACSSLFEDNIFAMSSIPTTGVALTRNAETNKYETLGNRTAAVESCVVKLVTEHTSTEIATTIGITRSDTKRRSLNISSVGDDVTFQPNASDSSGVIARTGSALTKNTEYTIGATCQHSSPYAEIYQDGISINQYTVGDFIDPAWLTYFWVGSDDGGANQLNGTIFSIAFFDRVLSPEEHLFLHNADWRTLR